MKIIFIKLLLFYWSVIDASIIKRDASDEEISICPYSHQDAYDYGRRCCSFGAISWDSPDCDGNNIPCPSSGSCEDYPNGCPDGVGYEGFGNEYDAVYHQRQEDDNNEDFFPFVNGKQVFRSGSKCVWWHRQYRHWWIGPCENVGTNSGYAYIDPDVRCPHKTVLWKRGGTDEPINGVEYNDPRCHYERDENGVIITGVCGATFNPPLSSSPTGGLNAIVKNGRYVQTCKWKFNNGRWRCR